MPDRIIRAGLLESDRWLDLRDSTERLAYVAALLKADDLGTLDATDGALVRLWGGPCNVHSREEAVKVLEALAAQDLVRTYTADGKRYIFVPRFRQRFRARTLKRPAPPAELLVDEPAILANLNEINARTEKMTGNCPQGADNCQASAPEVVVEGVVEGVETKAAKPARPRSGSARQRFDPLSVELPAGITPDAWRQLVEHRREIRHPLTRLATGRMIERLAALQAQGHDVAGLIAASIRAGWRDVFPPKAGASPPAAGGTSITFADRDYTRGFPS